MAPSYYYGRRHDYVYYPESWTDQNTGTSYEKGYYDETGQHYDSVAFTNEGKYENVVCRCPYCGQDTILNLTAEDVSMHNLQCPHCGGGMEIVSELDDYVTQAPENTHSYASEESLKQFRQNPKKKKRPWGIIVLAVLVLFGIGRVRQRMQEQSDSYTPEVQQVQQIDYPADESEILGDEVGLKQTGPNSYALSFSQTGDKTLVWEEETSSYYDEESDCWLWYNTYMDPPVWQYWYEGISSEFADSGWMEHDSDGWFIEESYGNWIELPAEYDSDRLWYIE